MQEFLKNLGIKNADKVHRDLSLSQLIEESLKNGSGHLSSEGALVVKTGKHTGRAAKDKYIVMTEETKEKVWWQKDLREMTPSIFESLKKEVLQYLNSASDLYACEKSVGADQQFNVSVRVLSPSPSHILFANHMFRQKIREFNPSADFTVLHAPGLQINPEKYDTRSETVIVTCFQQKLVLVIGSYYAGEIKKSLFSIMNYILPDQGILPMHSGANINDRQEVSVFFGLSGTGKTTLSTDEGLRLIGDDEHGLSSKGIFNFEGGCYAKTYKLSLETEPDIFKACNRFGALLENVVMNPKTREVDFMDKSIAENTRGSYPLHFIRDFEKSSRGPVPKTMFFLSADAFGVLPPVAKLSRNQAMYYFLSGYTAKVAGTEMGVVEPTAAFSTCFGAPFMTRKPEVYGQLLGKYLDELGIQVWLINTGWTGGAYGEGSRFSLHVTRNIIRSIQSHQLSQAEFVTDPIFGFQIPKAVPGVDSKVLQPKNTWKNGEAYDQAAKKLANMFHANIKNFKTVGHDILSGGPVYRD